MENGFPIFVDSVKGQVQVNGNTKTKSLPLFPLFTLILCLKTKTKTKQKKFSASTQKFWLQTSLQLGCHKERRGSNEKLAWIARMSTGHCFHKPFCYIAWFKNWVYGQSSQKRGFQLGNKFCRQSQWEHQLNQASIPASRSGCMMVLFPISCWAKELCNGGEKRGRGSLASNE